jgi:hypothetical protein
LGALFKIVETLLDLGCVVAVGIVVECVEQSIPRLGYPLSRLPKTHIVTVRVTT